MTLRPLDYFGIVTAELKRVVSLGRYMTVEGKVRLQPSSSTGESTVAQEGWQQLVKICGELESDSLYAQYANKKVFRHAKDFWATEETSVRQYVKRMADVRLVKAVRLAASLDIPMLYVPSMQSPLHISDRLQFDDERQENTREGEPVGVGAPARMGQEVRPLMNFFRHADGTTYQLQLRIGDRLIDRLSDHQLIVLGYEPGAFVLDGKICLMGDGFSGKLLLPFVNKPTVEIPRKMEKDYFRRFILRHVARAEINAEGFDIKDIKVEPQSRIIAETVIDGSWMLSLRFKYGNTEYSPDSETRGRVTLTEEDGSFRFIRQLRDKQVEQKQMKLLRQTEERVTAQGTIRFQSLADMVSWLRHHAAKLKTQNFDVVQPSDHIYHIGLLDVEQSDTWQGDWLQTKVTVVLDGGRLRIPFQNLRDTILRGEQEYMLPTGEFLLIPKEWIQRYTDLLLTGTQKGEMIQRHRSQITEKHILESENTEGTQQNANGVAVSLLQQPQDAEDSPKGLRATLRPYQLEGFQWLWQNLVGQTGCCLSDEMGLGKTIQTIALLLKYKEKARMTDASRQPIAGMLFSEEEMQGKKEGGGSSLFSFYTSLVVAPASVVHNWHNELARFAPSLLVMTYTGDVTKRKGKRQALARWDVVLTSYRTLLNDIGFFARQKFGIIVFDESQAFKTSSSQIHCAVSRLDAVHRLALSGTPVENNLNELWSLMNVLNPNLLGDEQTFQKTFVNPIAQNMEDSRRDLLRRLIAPYFLKRTKDEVLNDLPERQDKVVVCPMTDEQASRYAEELSKARNEWLSAKAESLYFQGHVANAPNSQTTIHMLAAIQRLRHIANGEGKLSVVFEQLENLHQTHHKVLLFSEYVTLLERVGNEMQSRGWQYEMLTGQTKQRERVIAHFQCAPDCQFFLVSLKAGGVGLNLTAADYVFMLDPWWNQAAEEQAIARSHRIGQHQPVFVYRFVSADTLEEQILTLQERKQSLIDSVMPFICNS